MSYYFDTAATAEPIAAAHQVAMDIAMTHYANPSSKHQLGKYAQAALVQYRKQIAQYLSVNTNNLIFTSGATEANTAIMGRFVHHSPIHIISSQTEHDSIYNNLPLLKKFHKVSLVKVQDNGQIDQVHLMSLINKDTRLVLLSWINHETGAIQPCQEIISLIRKHQHRPIHIHIDATQALGKVPIDLSKLGCDSAAFSGHKIGAPKGVGLLYLAQPLPPLFTGGGQEFQQRAGTENLPAIAGFATAIDHLKKHTLFDVSWYNDFIRQLQLMGAVILPQARIKQPELFTPFIINFALPPLPAPVVQRMLSKQGIMVGVGSACQSLKTSQIRGLLALGIDETLAKCALRVSFDYRKTWDEAQHLVQVLTLINKTALLL